MPNRIIKDGAVIEDNWLLLDKDNAEENLSNDCIIVPLKIWQTQREQLEDHASLGVMLNSDESPQLILEDLAHFQVIAINFPAFVDGRGFSYARELRDTHHYQGEIRAVGGFIRDQLFFLKRCGFNAFALSNTDIDSALASFDDFSESYQEATDSQAPLFRIR